ncbi:MAG TPA: hypothetical protein PLG09_05935 [Syntrophomonadaceae bacterium]|nr:hypothetical protein [Syntrophomonadaceae bacterium]HPU49168.1 hypothetical protein [Syntrophomonadaceae bacterium]
MGLRQQPAELMIRCPECKRLSNEYNWTLKTAAHFSIGEETCPSVLQVILATLEGQGDMFDGYRMICPRCNYGIDFSRIDLPDYDAVMNYAQLVGEDYCQGWY